MIINGTYLQILAHYIIVLLVLEYQAVCCINQQGAGSSEVMLIILIRSCSSMYCYRDNPTNKTWTRYVLKFSSGSNSALNEFSLRPKRIVCTAGVVVGNNCYGDWHRIM